MNESARALPPHDPVSPEGFDLKALAAQRVRAARKRAGQSRRVLAERSGVSQRYLAQLEAGEGNISIALLQRVALALQVEASTLLSETPDDPDLSELVTKYKSASPEARKEALAALAPKNQRLGRICLIGLRGAGKTTLGQLAAKQLNLPFVELNAEIEMAGGMPVAEIMGLYGQEGFRKLEREVLEETTKRFDRVILAASGGIVGEAATFEHLLAQYHTIWIKASPQEHMNRVRAQGDERPMADNPAAMDQLKSILRQRDGHYSRAKTRLDTSGATRSQSLEDLQRLIEEQGFLVPEGR